MSHAARRKACDAGWRRACLGVDKSWPTRLIAAAHGPMARTVFPRFRGSCALGSSSSDTELTWAQDKRQQALTAEQAAGHSVGRVGTDHSPQTCRTAAVAKVQPSMAAAAEGDDDAIAVSSSDDDVPLAKPGETSRRRGVVASMQVTTIRAMCPDAIMRRSPPVHNCLRPVVCVESCEQQGSRRMTTAPVHTSM